MRSFKEYIAERDLEEGILGNLQYRFNNFAAGPEQRAQSSAIDSFGTTYNKVEPKLTQQAGTMNQLKVPAAAELQKKVGGVGEKFDKVARKSRAEGIPVRNP